MNNICVFCGSGIGNHPIYAQNAKKLGKALAQNNIKLIYGGGRVGLMGTIADEVIENGGKVIGVIPEFLLEKEVGHQNLTEMHIVKSMHERKQKMALLADGFIAMPGGLGTLEELAEILTWVQLELIKKPVALLNVSGFYDHLLAQLDQMTYEGFLKTENRKNLLSHSNVEELISNLINFKFDNYSIWDDLDVT
jgi:uncharacterized protein (TIGR00730 family)